MLAHLSMTGTTIPELHASTGLAPEDVIVQMAPLVDAGLVQLVQLVIGGCEVPAYQLTTEGLIRRVRHLETSPSL